MSVNEKMTAIADAIRDKTGGTDALTLDDMAENVPKVFEAGKQELLSLHPEKTVSGSYLALDDVSELPHDVKCRVSGVDNPSSVTVTRCGANLFDKDNISSLEGAYFPSSGLISTGSNLKIVYIPCLPNADYVISKISSSRFGVGDLNKIPELGDTVKYHPYTDMTKCVFKTSNTARYMCFWYYNPTYDTDITIEEVEASININFGSSILPYEPYNGQTLTPSTDGTVGGMTSTYPQMSIFTDNVDAMLDVTYRISVGKQAEYDRFWNSVHKGAAVNTQSLFAGRAWNIDTFKPTQDIVVKDAYMCFYCNDVKGDLAQILDDLGVNLDTSKMTTAQYMFWNSNFTRIPAIDLRGIAQPVHTMQTFQTSTVRTIDKLTLLETTPLHDYAFRMASALENITFEGVIGSTINFQWCPLTKASITNIIEHLSSTATGQTCTFKKSAKEAAFTADEWAELIANKTNWTFSLV